MSWAGAFMDAYFANMDSTVSQRDEDRMIHDWDKDHDIGGGFHGEEKYRGDFPAGQDNRDSKIA